MPILFLSYVNRMVCLGQGIVITLMPGTLPPIVLVSLSHSPKSL